MLLRCESLEPPMSLWGHSRRFRDVRGTSALPPILTVTADIPDRQLGAMSGGEQPQQAATYSITSSATASSIAATSRPSAFAVLKLIASKP
jgi:hypothetical protein